MVATGFGGSLWAQELRVWVASVSFLTSFLHLLEEAWTAQRANRAPEPGQEQKFRCSSCGDVLLSHLGFISVLVSDLLGVAGDGMGWDGTPVSVLQSQEGLAWAWLEALGSCCCSARPGWIRTT